MRLCAPGIQVCRVGLLLALALLLAACATTTPARLGAGRALDRYAFDARFSLRQADRNQAGRLSWQHAGGTDSVLLQDPFGRGVAEIRQGPDSASARLADGRVVEAIDAAELVAELTGVRLPLAGIGRWLPARLAADAGARRDAFGRLVELRRDGWQIEYAYGEDTIDALPTRIFATYGDIELRLLVDSWELAP